MGYAKRQLEPGCGHTSLPPLKRFWRTCRYFFSCRGLIACEKPGCVPPFPILFRRT